jgi:hypothetical protein
MIQIKVQRGKIEVPLWQRKIEGDFIEQTLADLYVALETKEALTNYEHMLIIFPW